MSKTPGLTQQDAFFVAYQDASGVAMQVGAELELEGEVAVADLEATVARLLAHWPQLGQTVGRRLFGLAWQGPPRPAEMLRAGAEGPSLASWRNTAIDPWREPPLQLRWIPGDGGGTLALRAHHAALDGHALMVVGEAVLRGLAGETAPAAAPPPTRRPRPRGRLGPMWRYLRWLKRESRRGAAARLVVHETAPGDVGVHSRILRDGARGRLLEHARRANVPPAWLACAAWIRAIGAWNDARGERNQDVSLEVPVSLRPRGSRELGNGISPLLLSARADRPLAEVARALEKQFAAGVRQRAHFAVPRLTAGGRFLPWWLFRRLATDTAFSGFATSHFTWMRTPGDLAADVARLSGGRLALRGLEVYGPVCLHMGAALLVIESPVALHVSMTHRLNALTADDARRLADLVMAELLPEGRLP